MRTPALSASNAPGPSPTCPFPPAGPPAADPRATGTEVRRDGGRGVAERIVRRVLFVSDAPACPVLPGADRSTYRIFHASIAVSALRCLLSYVVFPIVTPLLGAATRVGPAIGLPIALVALVFDVIGIRRFWLSDHRWKWVATGVYAGVMTLVAILAVGDIIALV